MRKNQEKKGELSMAITPTTPIAGASQSSQTAAVSAFDGDAFMELLLTQLKYQDPLNPMNDQEMMAQLVQMNTLAEIQKLNTNVEAMSQAQTLSLAASLIGKVVQADSGGGPIQGAVATVLVNGSEVLLDLGSAVINLADVRMVSGA
jgi:flagellar basal-body rod modification protein FlgD